ncbi:MAG: POTRA domain-containing protein [Bacteroidota bacterium]
MKYLVTLLVLLALLTEGVFAQIGVGRRRTQPTPQQSVDYNDPQEYEIAEITVSGNKGLDANAIISLSGLSVGDKIRVPGPAVSSAIKKLWKSRILGDVSVSASKIENGKISLIISLAEKPRLSRIVLDGVNSSQETEITDDLTLIKGQIVDDALINRARLTVRNFFIDKGYLNVAVDIQQKQDTLLNNAIALNINVDKGSKVKINRINFTGNEALSGKKLKGKMKNTNERVRFTLVRDLITRLLNTKPKEAATFLTKQRDSSVDDMRAYINEHVKLNFFNGSKFIRDDFKTDKQAVIDFYNSRGYRDAAIVSDSVYKSGADAISIDIKVDEGNKYYFRDILWTGNYVYEDEVLERVLGIGKGDVYDLENLNKRLNFNPQGADVSALYMDNGYLFFRVEPIEVQIEEDSIDIEMRIFEGEQATISKIIITGNDRTNDHVIRREIRTLPGQKFSRELLIRTQRELSQLGYFDPEQIGINPIPNPAEGTVDIEYALVEKPSDQIELSGGWGGFMGFVGTLGLVFNNFSVKNIPHFDRWRPLPIGDGQKLSLRVQANGRFFQNYSATFSEPWLGGKKPNSLTVGLSHQIIRSTTGFGGLGGFNQFGGQFGGFGGRPQIGGSLRITNISVGLGRRLRWPDDYFTMSNSLVYRRYALDDYQDIGIGFTTGFSNNLSVNTTIARNSIDNPMFPRTGSSISLEVALTPPFSVLDSNIDYNAPITAEDPVLRQQQYADRYNWLEYHRWMFDAKHYTQLGKNLVLNTNVHFGFFGSYKDNVINSPFERFTLGGAGMAGQNFFVAEEQIGLRGYPDRAFRPQDETNARGGIAYNKFSAELRYLVSPNPAATIFVLGFVEGGNNFADFNQYNPFDLYKSAGVGARIFMPAFGLLGIDWGYGFDTIPNNIPGLQARPPGPEFHFRIGQQIR